MIENTESIWCHLPNDCWHGIFSYLPFEEKVIACRVCKMWSRIMRQNADYVDAQRVVRKNYAKSEWFLLNGDERIRKILPWSEDKVAVAGDRGVRIIEKGRPSPLAMLCGAVTQLVLHDGDLLMGTEEGRLISWPKYGAPWEIHNFGAEVSHLLVYKKRVIVGCQDGLLSMLGYDKGWRQCCSHFVAGFQNLAISKPYLFAASVKGVEFIDMEGEHYQELASPCHGGALFLVVCGIDWVAGIYDMGHRVKNFVFWRKCKNEWQQVAFYENTHMSYLLGYENYLYVTYDSGDMGIFQCPDLSVVKKLDCQKSPKNLHLEKDFCIGVLDNRIMLLSRPKLQPVKVLANLSRLEDEVGDFHLRSSYNVLYRQMKAAVIWESQDALGQVPED